ncbi:MAG: glycerate kinase [Bacteroidetes bacterium]|nr:glycerate kinase [Bacteroidota bacterium]
MENILIASDSFKDALTATEVCEAIAKGIQSAKANAKVSLFPLADGGEGTIDVLLHHLNGDRIEVEVNDPVFRPIKAIYGLSANGDTALIEMAAASGIQLLSQAERRALSTTTLGTGELIRHALDQGCDKIILAIGGSATNDGGMGMAQALGYRITDASGQVLKPIGQNLKHVAEINDQFVHPRLKDVEVQVICDVDNPLIGDRGATKTYGPQKGTEPGDIDSLEAGMIAYAGILEAHFNKPVAMVPGAGAAGGMGAASLTYLGGTLRPGVELVMDLCNFERALQGIDIIVTGEGRIDHQTVNGKLVKGICNRAAEKAIPVIGLCGSLQADPDTIEAIGLKAAFSISPGAISLEEALRQTGANLEGLSRQLFKLL